MSLMLTLAPAERNTDTNLFAPARNGSVKSFRLLLVGNFETHAGPLNAIVITPGLCFSILIICQIQALLQYKLVSRHSPDSDIDANATPL